MVYGWIGLAGAAAHRLAETAHSCELGNAMDHTMVEQTAAAHGQMRQFAPLSHVQVDGGIGSQSALSLCCCAFLSFVYFLFCVIH